MVILLGVDQASAIEEPEQINAEVEKVIQK